MASGGDIEKGKVDESASVLVEHGPRTSEEWESTLLRDDSPMPLKCCIFRVPEVLRRQHKEAYEPDIVSIGPFHFHRGGKEQFKLVENVKKWYLSCVLKRLDKPLASLVESVIQKLEKPARECYEDTFVHLDQNNFVEMLILDGCFLIELLRKTPVYERQDEDDPIFNLSCMLEYLYHDLLLLENQLPWFVLEFFYELIESDNPKRALSEVIIDFFKQSVADPDIFSYPEAKSSGSINHILDLIRTALVQGHQKPTPDPESSNTNKDKDHGHLPQRIPSAASLSEAGVTFKNGAKKEGESVCILDIQFEKGVFTIPPLAIDERTEPMFRNLMVFEQCYFACKHLITSYAVLMDNLIDTDKDVNLLCEKGIIANWLSAEDASNFFNKLYNDTTVYGFEYKELCNKVHDYHNNTWNRWREKLKRDYFDTPWSTISFFAAFVLLVLTFLQTIYTVQTYYHPPAAPTS